MIKKEINLYTFDELAKEIQEKVINNFRNDDGNDLTSFLADDMAYKLDELLKQNKITGDIDKVYCSLTYCQGDGAMFTGSFKWKKYNVEIKHSGRYYHYNSKTFSITDDEGNDKSEYDDEFDPIYVKICKELEKYGYKHIEEATSDEAIKDLIKMNGYTFRENGDIENI